MRLRSRLRDPLVAVTVVLIVALVAFLAAAFVPVVPHNFSTSFGARIGESTLAFPPDSWVSGTWSAPTLEGATFDVVPTGGSPILSENGTSGTFSFFVTPFFETQSSYRFFLEYMTADHEILFDPVFVNGTYFAPLV